MIKDFFKKLHSLTPSWVFMLLALFSGIMSFLGLGVTLKLGGVQFVALYSWITGGYVDNQALAVAILAGVLCATFTYFARASYILLNAGLKASEEGR